MLYLFSVNKIKYTVMDLCAWILLISLYVLGCFAAHEMTKMYALNHKQLHDDLTWDSTDTKWLWIYTFGSWVTFFSAWWLYFQDTRKTNQR